MSDEPAPTPPETVVQRGALSDTVQYVAIVGGALHAAKLSYQAGGHFHDLLHPPKDEPPKPPEPPAEPPVVQVF